MEQERVDEMTRYEKGFMDKCAEAGVPVTAALGMLKQATILTRLAKNPRLRNIRLTDSRIMEEVVPYLKWLYKNNPNEAKAIMSSPNATVGPFMDAYKKAVRAYKAGKNGFLYQGPHSRGTKYNYYGNSRIRGTHGKVPKSIARELPYRVRSKGSASAEDMDELLSSMLRSPGTMIQQPRYDELVRAFGADNANRYAERAIDYMDMGGLMKEMSRRGMSTREIYNAFTKTNPSYANFSSGDVGARLSDYFKQGVERGTAGPRYGIDYDSLFRSLMATEDRIPLQVSGKFNPATGFTRRQRREISRQLAAEYRKLFGRDPTFQGRPIRMFVDSHPITMDSANNFNSSFNPVGGGRRSQRLDTIMNRVLPDDSMNGFDLSLPKEVQRYKEFLSRGPLRPEISTSVIMDNNGKFYFPRQVFRHEAGHGMSMDANPGELAKFYEQHRNRFPVLDVGEGIDLSQRISSTAGAVPPAWYKPVSKNPLSGDRTFMEELSANLRGGIGNESGYTPALATYASALARTPEQRAFADNMARRMGVYRPNPFAYK